MGEKETEREKGEGSEKERSGEPLQIQDEKYRYLFEESPAAVLVIAGDGTIARVNRALYQATHYDPGDIIGRLAADFVVPEQREEVEKLLGRIFNGEWTPESEVNVYAADGTTHTLLFAPGHAFVYEGDKPPAALLTGLDITEWKRSQERLRDAARMEALVALAGAIAHDFNNLLMVILNYTKILGKKNGMEPSDGEMLGEILEAAERAQGLTRKLLLFSRRNMRREETVDLNGLLERMRETLKKCLKKNVNMKTSLASGLRKVCIDPGLCENVIENLVMNSNEAVSEGGTITIKTANEEAATGCVVPGGEPVPGSYVTITVADDGPGMDRETRRLIFDPFFTTKEANEAEGLGLSIVYGIVKQCRGEIVVESEPGRGTAIKVYLPSANR